MKKLFSVIFIGIVSVFLFAENNKTDVDTNIEMLNYMSTLSAKIMKNKSDRVELSKIMDQIYKNLLPSEVDYETQNYINSLNDRIMQFTLISKEKERLTYIQEQNRAKNLVHLIPNPIYMLSFVNSGMAGMSGGANFDPRIYAINSVITMVTAGVSSLLTYASNNIQSELDIVKEYWKLEDKDYEEFETLRINCFNHMINIARRYNIDSDKILTEYAINHFADLESETNLQRRLNDLENSDNSELYKNSNYGPYYILLINTYYDLAQEYVSNTDSASFDKKYLISLYKKCIDAYKKYSERNIKLFRKDFELANVLPKVIFSAKQVLSKRDYLTFALNCLTKINEETFEEDWAIRYFAALTYIQLAEEYKGSLYYDKAIDLLFRNISYLAKQQEKQLLEYSNPIDETIPETISKKDKKYCKERIKIEKAKRKTMLLPMSDALKLNLDLLLSIKNIYTPLETQWNSNVVSVINDAVLNVLLRKEYFMDNVNNNILIDFADNNCKYITVPLTFVDEEGKIIIKGIRKGDNPRVISCDLILKTINRPKKRQINTLEEARNYINSITVTFDVSPFTENIDLTLFDQIEFTIEGYNQSKTVKYKQKDIGTVKTIINGLPFIDIKQFERVN